nr:tetratricopeptide repeat protein [Micromonospora sp. DSM 115978]
MGAAAANATGALVTDNRAGWALASGVIVALLTAFSPGLVHVFRQLATDRRQRDSASMAADDPQVPRSVARLLHPSLEVVPFSGRSRDLQSLERWCNRDTEGPVRLLVAGDGVGKTRLARQLQRRLSGWRTLWVRVDAERISEFIAHEEPGIRLLLLLDDAESRDPAALAGLLVAVASSTARVRLLLLARSAGPWWTGLSSSAPSQAKLIDTLTIDTSAIIKLVDEVDDRPPEDVVTEAIGAFAACLRRQPPAGYQPRQHDSGTPLLRLHAEALLAVLGAPHDAERHDVLAEILSHEVQYWRSSAQRSGLTLPPRPEQSALLLRRLVGITALQGPIRHDLDLAEVLARVPWPPDTESYRDQDWSSWLSALYPATMPDGLRISEIGTLEPDLLAEHLAVEVLVNCTPAERTVVFTGLQPRQARRALTLLGQAHTHRSADVLPILESAISADVPILGAIAIRLTRLFPGLFTPILLTVLPRTELDSAQLRVLALSCPYPSRELHPVALHLIGRILDAHSPSTPLEERAEWCFRHSLRLTEAGRRADAVTWSEQAVTLHRELAHTDPETHLPDLALSVNNHAVNLAAVGRHTDAFTWSEEAVTHYRALARSNRDAHLPDLARSVHNHASRLAQVGRPAEALTWSEEAVTLRRALTSTDPDAHLPDLAASVHNHALRLANAGRRTEALTWSEEAVTHYRALTRTSREAHLAHLAMSLWNVGYVSAMFNEASDSAIAATTEAVAYLTELADAELQAFQPRLQATTGTLIELHHIAGNTAEADRLTAILDRNQSPED